MTTTFEQLFEHSPVAMLVVDAQRSIHLVNRQAEELFDYPRADLVGQEIELLVPHGVRPHHPELVADFLAAPTPRQMGMGRELFGLKRGDVLFPIEVGLNPTELDGEQMVVASVIDITERQRADEHFKAAVEAAPNGMLMIDSQRSIVLCNRQVERIFGYAESELVGRSIEVLVPDEFKGAHPGFVEAFFRAPASRAMGVGRELFGRHKSGRLVPVEIGLQPLQGPLGDYVISSIVDITARRAAEAEIQRKTAEIEEFAYRTSHDLRSPLQSITLMAECIAEDIRRADFASASNGAEQIRRLSRRLLALIEDILILTRVDVASEPITEFSFDDYARESRDKFLALFDASGVVLRFEFGHTRPLRTQAARLTQVLDNLISNGAKYRDDAKSDRFVLVRTSSEEGRFLVQVEDNGLGFPLERQEDAFGMFQRFHSGPVSGSGLGLYIVKKQVAKLGAEIALQSSASGSVFALTLPLQPG